MHEGQELVRRAASSFGFMKLARRKHKISFFIADWHSDLRHRSGFEPPLSKSIDRGFIENRITGALLHGRIGHFADRGINRHNANPAASDMGVLRLVGVHGGRGANDLSFCGGQGHHIRSGRFGRSLGCCMRFYPGFLFFFHSGCCQLSCTGRLLRGRNGLLMIWCPS